MGARARRPGVRADRNLCPLRSARERDRVGSLGKQVVRNELVKAFVAFINQIELHYAVVVNSLTPNRLQSLQMELQDRLETALHFRAGGYFIQGVPGQIANNLFNE